MSRKTWFVVFLVLCLAVTVAAKPRTVKEAEFYNAVMVQDATPIIGPNTPINTDLFVNLPLRDIPAQVAIGEDMIVGYTWYDYQHNGTIGNMVRHDSQGGTHFIWMRGYQSNLIPRHVVYNYLDADGSLLVEAGNNENQVDAGTKSGYTCMDLLPHDERAIVFYHVEGYLEDDPAYVGTGLSADWSYARGAFQASHPVSWPEVRLIWPHGAVDRRNFGHILATEYNEDVNVQVWQRIGYWRATPDQNHRNWTFNVNRNGVPLNIDTTGVISSLAAASPQSNKVALGWHHNLIGTSMQRPNGDWTQGPWQRNNDVRYIISNDGENWDWARGVRSMTHILPIVPELADVKPASAYGDTFRPFCDLDIEFDPWEGQDNLYGVFAAAGFWEKPIGDDDPWPAVAYAVHGHLWFWNSIQDTLTMIYDGWYNGYNPNPNRAANSHFRPGGWRVNADRGSIVFDPDNPGHIYIVWICFPHIQNFRNDGSIEFLPGAQDTSSRGYQSADVMVSASVDYGITWQEPVNVTGTIWDGDRAPEAGECLSEGWGSADPLVRDGMIHIFYVRDTDAGGLPQNEGVATNSPMVYHRVPIEEIPLDGDPVAMPRAGFMFHNYPDYAPAISDVARAVGTPLPAEEVGVTARVVATGGKAVSRVYLEYFLPGAGQDTVQIEMSANNDIFSGVIPGQENGQYVWYRIHAYNVENGQSFIPLGWWNSYIVRGEGEMTIHDIQYPGPREWGVDYSPFLGFEVTVEGVVTTPPVFVANYGAFAIQEAPDYFSGVFVRGADRGLDPGTRVQVTGTVFERDPNESDKWRYLTYIQVASEEDVVIIREDPPMEPMFIPHLRSIASMAAYAEHLEGVLVRVWDCQAGDSTEIDSVYRPIYRPITKTAIVNGEEVVEKARITMHGLSDDAVRELGLRNMVEGDTIHYLTGVFCENQAYALAPMNTEAFAPFSAPFEEKPVPRTVRLEPAYPNPFNGITKLGFELNAAQNVKLAIYDVAGRTAMSVLEGRMQAGHHTVALDASELATGVYILRLEAPNMQASQKLVLIK